LGQRAPDQPSCLSSIPDDVDIKSAKNSFHCGSDRDGRISRTRSTDDGNERSRLRGVRCNAVNDLEILTSDNHSQEIEYNGANFIPVSYHGTGFSTSDHNSIDENKESAHLLDIV
jgi:hypothetical protein